MNWCYLLQKKHPEILELALTTKPVSQLDTDQKSLLSCGIKQRTQKYGRDDTQQVNLEQKMIDWNAGDLRPLTTIQSSLFRDFLEAATPKS